MDKKSFFNTIAADLHEQLAELTVVSYNEDMSQHTTFHTGGSAEIFAVPRNEDEISAIMMLCTSMDVPLTVIGGGSNLLVSDRGIDGVVMKIASLQNVSSIQMQDDGCLKVPAAMMKQDFIDYSIEHGLSGLQFSAGVPGSVGGGIYMNAGTFMGSFTDVMTHVHYIDRYGHRSIREITDNFSSYRSIQLEQGAVITGGVFSLYAGHDPEKLSKEFNDIYLDRESKHPLEYPSAGSVFKNPEGHSSWKLIDDAGLKGFSIGGASVSEKHTNFIINSNNASSEDIYKLINHIQETVEKRFGVSLETEIRRIGTF